MTPTGVFRLSPRLFSVACCLALGLSLGVAHAQDSAKKAPDPSYEPTVGQQGKDVVWVPTPQSLVNRMLEMAKVTPSDILFDLGSGDGRTVITAAKRGVKATGVEYNPDMVALSRRNAEKEGVGSMATFIHGDIFETDFSHATVITLFLLPDLNLRLRPTILDMKPGTRVVSNSFNMNDWQSDDYQEVTEDCRSYCRAYLWIVPAKVAGTWKLPQGELKLEQKFQMVTGTLTLDGKATPISEGRLNADTLTFKAGGQSYTGKVEGASIALFRSNAVGTATRESK